jgi:uncharacterized membrane protein
MNLHPIFVHFPIALLSLYAVFELIRWRKLAAKEYWFHVKAVLVIVGFIASFIAIATGPEGQNQAALVGMHENFAWASTILFGIIALLYAIAWLQRAGAANSGILKSAARLEESISKPWVLVLLAVIGLALITITGALGGAITYGPDVDPVASFVYHILF